MSIKKTYIPAKPRSSKLVGTSMSGGVAGSVSSSSADPNAHSHSNKVVLDKLTDGDIDVLGKLSLDEDGNIKVDTTLWATGGISALGLGEGGEPGTGGDFDRLDAWVDYNETKANWVLSALLGYDLHTRVNSLEASGGSSNIEIAITGSGNAITGVSLSGNTLTFAKGSSFSLSNHNHDTLYKPIGYAPSWGEITGKPSTFAPSAHTHDTLYKPIGYAPTWGEVTGKPTTFAPSAHNHDTLYKPIGYVPSWSEITGKPSTFAPSAHTHTIAQVTGLQSALDNKEPIFTKNTAFNKNFGTTSGTVAQGNDSRINNGQTAFEWGNHSSAGYALNSALTAHINKADNPHAVTTSQIGAVDLTTNQSIGGVKSFTGNVTAPKILINKAGNTASGISWYNSAYNAWQDYMANSGTTGNGVNANITAPSGTLVTALARRSFIEGTTGYGWTFEKGTNSSTTPSVVAEIRASDGSAKFGGSVTASSGVNTPKVDFGNGFTIEPSGTELVFKYNGVIKQRMLSGGTILATAGITALSTE